MDDFANACDIFNICEGNESAIQEYTNDSKDFNTTLKTVMTAIYKGKDKGELGDELNTLLPELSIPVWKMCALLIKAYTDLAERIQKKPSVHSSNMTLYHGGKLFKSTPSALQTIRILGFLSTSFKKTEAQKFVVGKGHLYIISIPKHMYPMCINECSEYNEEEFLLPIGTKLIIDEIKTEGEKQIVYCTAMPPSTTDITAFISLFKAPVKKGGSNVNPNLVPPRPPKSNKQEEPFTVSEEEYEAIVKKIMTQQHLLVGGQSGSFVYVLNRSRKIIQFVKYNNKLLHSGH